LQYRQKGLTDLLKNTEPMLLSASNIHAPAVNEAAWPLKITPKNKTVKKSDMTHAPTTVDSNSARGSLKRNARFHRMSS